MIQRIQSFWLLCASVCGFASLKFSFFTGNVNEVNNGVAAATKYIELNGFSNIPLTILTITIAIVCLIAIFLYKNRKLQMRLCFAGVLVEAIVLTLYYKESAKYILGTYSLASLLQLLILLFLILSIKGINNDNKIIAESDRLR
jgi:hypothetical protein